MAFLSSNIFDSGLNYLVATCNRLDICSITPTTYAQATSTYSLGNKAAPVLSGPTNRAGGGREVTIQAITDGLVTGTNSATCYALTGNSELLAVQLLSGSQVVTTGNTFTLTAFTIGIPNPD